MRRHVVFLFTVMASVCCHAYTWQDSQYNDWEYTVSGGEATITTMTRFKKRPTETLVIPSEVNGIPVVGIGDSAFKGCTGLWRVRILNGVKSIGSSAFNSCSALLEVEIPEGMTNIGNSAFAFCNRLTSISIPQSVRRVGDSAFQGCVLLESVGALSDTVSIGNCAFYGCSKLADEKGFVIVGTTLCAYCGSASSVSVPVGVTTVGGSAFSGSEVVTYVSIPFGVTCIGNQAFANCSRLAGVSLPNSIERIGDYAFMYCRLMTSMGIPSSVKSIGESAFMNCTGLTRMSLPDSVTNIGKCAFAWCEGLSDVKFSAGIKEISEGMLEHCSRLMSVVIPNSVTNIGRNAFYDCYGLRSISMPNGLIGIGSSAFLECSGLRSVTIPPSVLSIGGSAFSECTGLESIAIPENVKIIEGSLFYGCSSLASVTMPDGVKSIGNSAFRFCSGLTSVSIPDGVTSIGWAAFSSSGLKSVTIPAGVMSIEGSTFSSCTGLTSVSIPEGVKYIGSDAFESCSSLVSIAIPSSVTSIGAGAFRYCGAIESIVIPFIGSRRGNSGSEEALFGYIFGTSSSFYNGWVKQYYGQSSYCYCNIPKSLKSVVVTDETVVGYGAFYGCNELTLVTIPGGVKSIGSYAFYGCKGLASMIIPGTVATIGDFAFNGCNSLESVSIASTTSLSMANVGDAVFEGTKFLDNCPAGPVIIGSCFVQYKGTCCNAFVVPEGVTIIAGRAFYECCELTSVTIPNSVISIGALAFYGCSNLTSVSIPESVMNIGDDAFGETRLMDDQPDGLIVVADCLLKYKGSSPSVLVLPENVRVIANRAFYGCHELTSVRIPPSVVRVGGEAFYGCSSLKCVYLPFGVEIASDAIPISARVIRPVSVMVSGCEKAYEYDGMAKSYDFEFVPSASQYDLANVTNTLPVLSAKVGMNQVELTGDMFLNTNEDYEVTFAVNSASNTSEVVILPRPVAMTTGLAQKVYDGTPLVCSDVIIGGDGFVVGECVARAVGSQTCVGSSKNTVCLEWAAGALESNYSIVTNEGTLTVLPAKVTKKGEEPGTGTKPVGGISKFDGEVVKYDGEGHTINVAELEEVTLVADTPSFSYSLTSNGVYRSEPYYFTNACVTSVWYKISAANYEDYVHEARVTILPREVTLTSGSANKNFDGTALRCERVEVTGDGFVACEGVDVVYTGSQLWSGTSENTFTYSFKQGTLASNYDVATVNGALTVGAAGRVVVDASVTAIPAEAFKDYTELTEVVLPETVTEIGADAFAGCTKLTKVRFPSGMEVTREKLRRWGLSDAVLDDYVEGDFVIVNTSLLGYVGAADVAELAIPDGIERIDEYALAELYDLERVELPETVKYIGKGAFANDTYLDEVVLPDSVEVIGEGAFADCSWMRTMTMGAGVRSVGNRAFAGCTKLAAAKFAEGLGEVGDAAFSNCWRMMSVSLPVSVSNVAETAFTDCASLTGVTVPTGCGRAGARPSQPGTMADWFAPVYRQIENVTVPEGTTEVCAEMFAGCAALKTVELPEGVTNIASGAFCDCVALETILLPESLEEIGDEAFAGCAALKAIVLPKNVAVLGKRVFSGCAALSDVTLSRALTAIPDGTFAGCDALDSFVVPEAVTELGSQIVSSATTAIYYLGNAPAYAADVYAQANASLVSYVVEGTKGWDGRPASRDVPRNWPTTNARAITTWPPIKIDVTFVGNGGAFENPAGESCVCKQIVDTAYSLPPYEPVRKGYRFDGYWTEAKGGTRVTSGVAVKLTKDHSLYAHWKEYDTPTIEGDEGATVTGDAESGFVIRPSREKTSVVVTIPQGVDAAKVTVEVSAKVATVKPNGAKVKVVVGENDITSCLVIPESDGVMNIAAAMVKEEIVRETLDPSKDAVIELDAANPQLITAPTRKGLTYTLYEGHRLESLSKGDSKLGDGDPWKPSITVSGGDAAFYLIDVSK